MEKQESTNKKQPKQKPKSGKLIKYKGKYIDLTTEENQIIRENSELNQLHFLSHISEQKKYNQVTDYNQLIESSYNRVDEEQTYIDEYKTYLDNLEFSTKNFYEEIISEQDIDRLLNTINKIRLIPANYDMMSLYDTYRLRSNIDYAHDVATVYANSDIPNHISPDIISNRLLSLMYSDKLTNNRVTLYDNTYITTETRNKMYDTVTIGELLTIITDGDYKLIDKTQRKQLYSTFDGTRPTNNNYTAWNGLLIIDLDLKEWEKRTDKNGKKINDIKKLKRSIHDILCRYPWYMWICTSSSGKGLHIYTKVSPAHHIHINMEDNNDYCKYWYMVNYNRVSSCVYEAMYGLSRKHGNYKGADDKEMKHFDFEDDDFIPPTNNEYGSGFEIKFLDTVTSRITTGVRVSYDPFPFVNEGFTELPVFFDLCNNYNGKTNRSYVNKIHLRDSKIHNRLVEDIDSLSIRYNQDGEVVYQKQEELFKNAVITSSGDVKILPKQDIKYTVRYNICNTLAALVGGDEGLEMAHHILRSKELGNENEIKAFYSSAIRNRKNPTKYGLDTLKRLGYHIAIQVEPDEKSHIMEDGMPPINVDKDKTEELDVFLGNRYKTFLRNQIQKTISKTPTKHTIKLNDGEYLDTYRDEIVNLIRNDRINIIISPAGSGKTTFFKELSKTKRILLVMPFISVIQNKIVTDPDMKNIFDWYYGDNVTTNLRPFTNAVMTFDKFSMTNEDIMAEMYDYIVIDEEHLLFNSSYRIDTTSACIRKIKSLYYIASNNDNAAKVVLMTGTETGSSYFFHEVSNKITVAKQMLKKTMTFHICDDESDTLTKMTTTISSIIGSYRDSNRKVTIIVPTNRGDVYVSKVTGMVSTSLGSEVKWGYYKRANMEQDVVQLINKENTVSDYEILYCTDYLSVGIDIEDTDRDFYIMYYGHFAGYEIEQFNSRVRKTDINAHYFIKTLDGDGCLMTELIEEPKVRLNLTEDDIIKFNDDKQISTKKEEFVAVYDPILERISTPGFNIVGEKVKFNKEEYELINFESKYDEANQHPLKITRILSMYGYDITVSNTLNMLNKDEKEKLSQIGRNFALQERQYKHSLIYGTFRDLVENNTVILADVGGIMIKDIAKNTYKRSLSKDLDKIEVIEDRDMDCYVKFNTDVMGNITEMTLKSKEAYQNIISNTIYILSKYNETSAIRFFEEFIREDGTIKLAELDRRIRLLKLLDKYSENDLSVHINHVLNDAMDFVDKFHNNPDFFISHKEYKTWLDKLVDNYIGYIQADIKTDYGYEKVKKQIYELISSLVSKKSTRNKIRLSYTKMIEPDSNDEIDRKSLDHQMSRLFELDKTMLSHDLRILDRLKFHKDLVGDTEANSEGLMNLETIMI